MEMKTGRWERRRSLGGFHCLVLALLVLSLLGWLGEKDGLMHSQKAQKQKQTHREIRK